MQLIVAGFVLMIALAGGLAFGLGGKEVARDILEKIMSSIQKKSKR